MLQSNNPQQHRHYSNRDRKILSEKIKSLGHTEHNELLRVLVARAVQYTQNSNGVFINISALDDTIISEIDHFVTFCMDNMQELELYDKRLNDCKRRTTNRDADACNGAASNGQVEETNDGSSSRPQDQQQQYAAHAVAQAAAAHQAATVNNGCDVTFITQPVSDIPGSQASLNPKPDCGDGSDNTGSACPTWDDIIDAMCKERRDRTAAGFQNNNGSETTDANNTNNNSNDATHTAINGTHHGTTMTNRTHINPHIAHNSHSGASATKKTCTKFSLAKKKFSKKRTIDASKTQELASILLRESDN
jgi:hypothetical protein